MGGAIVCAAQLAFGQTGLPTTQPKMLTIIREEVKIGRGADHAAHEAGWPAALEKAKSPDYYLAMTSMTGSPEAWYVVSQESHAAIAASMKREDKDPVLSAELERLAARDAEFIKGVTIVQAVGRPDLSFGKFPEVAKARYFEIHTFTPRQGMEEKFEGIMKLYAKVRARVAPDSSYRTYQVIAGMPTPTYFIFVSVDDYGQFDITSVSHMKTITGVTPAEKAELDKWSECVVKMETNRFKVDAKQSYVPKETRAADPDFWMPK